MTMDMNMHHPAVLAGSKTGSPATSESSDRPGSPSGSPSSSPILNNNNNNNNEKLSTTLPPKTSIKRSFDVAFLMAPDDLSTIKKRHQQQEQQLRLVTTASLMMRSALTPLTPMTPLDVSVTPPHTAEQQQQAFSRQILQQHPPSLMIAPDAMYRHVADRVESGHGAGGLPSAFTKVTTSSQPLLLMQNPPLATSPSSVSSMSGGLSPDHTTYQNSLSPPPVAGPASSAASPPSHGPGAPGGLPFQSQPLAYGAPPFYVPQAQPPQAQPSQGSPQTSPQPEKERKNVSRRYSPPFNPYSKPPGPAGADLMAGFQKLRPGAPGMLYPDSLAAYTNLAAAAAAAYPFGAPGFGAQAGAPPPVPNHGSALAAAAVVSASLLPPTFAALSLPAQNVCAKCNVSFRMTSDLVYHMRAHHKSDHAVNDPSRRRREQDKLKCPVCAESFRERHHLTRHMTAHQDKDSDAAEEAEQAEAGVSVDKSVPSVARRRNLSGVPSSASSIMAGAVAK